MTELLLLWLGCFGLILFASFGEDFHKKYWWLWPLGSAITGAMLAVPIYLILLAAAKILTR